MIYGVFQRGQTFELQLKFRSVHNITRIFTVEMWATIKIWIKRKSGGTFLKAHKIILFNVINYPGIFTKMKKKEEEIERFEIKIFQFQKYL